MFNLNLKLIASAIPPNNNLLIRMKYLRQITLILALLFGVAASGYADDIIFVNDTWADGDRTSSGPDGSGIDSPWYATSGTSLTATTGKMTATMSTNSLTFLTYFAPDSNPITLSGAGDELKITWTFTPNSVNSSNTSQNFLFATVDTPTAALQSADGFSVPSAQYYGYAMYCNMGNMLNNGNPYQLRKWSGTSADFLAHSANWTALTNGATRYNHGYDSGTNYTMVWTITRNASDGLVITNTMTGGTLNNTGTATASYIDTNPAAYTFDTFCVRPANSSTTAGAFDTTLFKVEFIPGASPPAIQTDTQDQTAFVGQNATFNVLASGTAPLSYQWYYNTNTVLPNATSSILTLTNVQLTNAGGYSVVVTNVYGSVTSSVAQLTVNIPVAPSITVQPQDQPNILPGATATFSVEASGTDPLNYQWYYNTNTLLANATGSTLTITNVQPGNAGSYSVTVSNFVGGVISSNAFLTVNTNPVAPVFISQPAWLVVLAGSAASFTASAAGTAPIGYQWNKNGIPIPGATSSTLILTNVQVADDGSYTLTATNSVGTATSNPAQLTVMTTPIPPVNSAYNLVGFAQATTGGGVIATNDPAYVQVYTPLDFANALQSAYKTAGSVKVIEIMNDLSLGWKEVGATVQAVGPFRSGATPLLHPVLLTVGESVIDIKPRSGLTIFSANGATIKHCNFNIKSCTNIIVRNLKFDENWEWDESTKGQYDRNDWDFITLGNGGAVSNIWVDHCTFTKSYDGILDTKAGCSAITISWCKYTGDDGATNTNSWVWQQINSLESNKTSYAMYNFLRTRGFSTTNIVTIMQGHDKTHLAGQNNLDPNNATISMTFHHLWLNSVWDRCVPRLRAGNVHDYNLYVDDTSVLAALNLRKSIAATMSSADQQTLNNTYSFDPPINGAISTEGGALLVEKSVYIDCLYPLRNNQTDPSNPQYTGKIKALDTIYQMNSTVIRGNSTDPGNPMGPFQAVIIPFSWNTNSGAPNGQLPYTYTMDDPGQLQAIVTSPTAGAGAGVLTWNKTNWLMTSYSSTAPTIVADPQSQTYPAGQDATFTVVAGGSTPFSYQWYYNTNTPIANATNAFLTLAGVQATNAGIYSVIVSNSAGSANSAYALLTVTANTAPTLSPIADTNINAGVTLVVASVATDTDAPPQTLTFSLLGAPTNATLNTNSGVFTWRPLVTQANTTNLVTIAVSDSGTPSLSATQSFNVIVNPLTQPNVTSSAWVGGQMQLTVAGEVGPDYAVQASTNLSLTNWQTIFITNSPPSPFNWIDTNTATFRIRFYRVVLGPPLP
jgi:pectate lyase